VTYVKDYFINKNKDMTHNEGNKNKNKVCPSSIHTITKYALSLMPPGL